jgi:galactokinase/mevalonate kinase-like predicted kinase
MITASASGRAGLLGNPTDMYGGSVISCSVTERAVCQISESPVLALSVADQRTKMRSKADLRLKGDALDIPKAVLQCFDLDPASYHREVVVSTDIPEQAGLAGSTAMLVAVLGSVLRDLGVNLNQYQIAETARKIESDVLKITCGYQDHYMAAFGGLNYLDFLGKENLGQSTDEPYATIERLAPYVDELPIILAHTGVKRNSGTVHGGIRRRWEAGEKAVVEGYIRIAWLARQGKKALLAGEWARFAEMMNENHRIQRDLGGSGPANEYLIETAVKNGAIGAKLAGAGRGGTIAALTFDKERTAAALREAGAERILSVRPVEGLVVEQS